VQEGCALVSRRSITLNMSNTRAPLPRFTDLRAVARDLSGSPQFAKLDKAIRQTAMVQSCVGDLSLAKTTCEALAELRASPRKRGSVHRAATEFALLMSAVTLYARATRTSGSQGERGSVSIVGKLTADQLEDHEALIDIRNRALAHVYSGEATADGVWHVERLFAVDYGDIGWQPASVTKRFQFNQSTFARLLRQIPVAHALVLARFHERIRQLTDLLNGSNDATVELFESHLFNPVEIFGSVDGVWRALEARKTGSGMGLT